MSVQNESRDSPNGRKVRYAVVGAGWISQEDFPKTDQFGAETKYFSQCILYHRDPEPDGEEGLADIRVLRAIEEALESGMPKPVMPRSERQSRPCREQIIRLPAVKSEELISAAAPDAS